MFTCRRSTWPTGGPERIEIWCWMFWMRFTFWVHTISRFSTFLFPFSCLLQHTLQYIYIHIFGWIITSYNDRTSTSSEWWSVGVPMPVSEGNQSVPTTFDDMFCFNAAVMGLENRDWMHLGSFGWLRKHPQNRPEVEKWCSSTLQGA